MATLRDVGEEGTEAEANVADLTAVTTFDRGGMLPVLFLCFLEGAGVEDTSITSSSRSIAASLLPLVVDSVFVVLFVRGGFTRRFYY